MVYRAFLAGKVEAEMRSDLVIHREWKKIENSGSGIKKESKY